MVVKRDLDIKNFKPADYYVVEGTFTTDAGESYKGIHKSRKFEEKSEADKICTENETAEFIAELSK